MDRRFVLTALMTLAALATQAQAAGPTDFPAKPVKLIVPFPPAGGADIVTRILVDQLSSVLGQPVIVENMAGASGDIGVARVVKSAPDGYTVVLGANTLATNSHISKLPFDPIKDLIPVGRVAASPLVVVAHPSVKANTLSELVALSIASSGELSFGTPGTATPMHLAGELIKRKTGAKLIHVPYRGSGPAISDVLGGHIPLMITSQSPILDHVKAGRLKAIAVLGEKRVAQLPNTPTAKEGGVEGVEAEVWYGYFVPIGTPSDVVSRLEAAFKMAASSESVVRKYHELGLEASFVSSAKLAQALKREHKQWGEVIRAAGITAQE